MTLRWRTVEVPFTGTFLMTVLEGDDERLPDETLRRIADDVLAEAAISFPDGDLTTVDEWIVPEDAPIREVETREVG